METSIYIETLFEFQKYAIGEIEKVSQEYNNALATNNPKAGGLRKRLFQLAVSWADSGHTQIGKEKFRYWLKEKYPRVYEIYFPQQKPSSLAKTLAF